MRTLLLPFLMLSALWDCTRSEEEHETEDADAGFSWGTIYDQYSEDSRWQNLPDNRTKGEAIRGLKLSNESNLVKANNRFRALCNFANHNGTIQPRVGTVRSECQNWHIAQEHEGEENIYINMFRYEPPQNNSGPTHATPEIQMPHIFDLQDSFEGLPSGRQRNLRPILDCPALVSVMSSFVNVSEMVSRYDEMDARFIAWVPDIMSNIASNDIDCNELSEDNIQRAAYVFMDFLPNLGTDKPHNLTTWSQIYNDYYSENRNPRIRLSDTCRTPIIYVSALTMILDSMAYQIAREIKNDGNISFEPLSIRDSQGRSVYRVNYHGDHMSFSDFLNSFADNREDIDYSSAEGRFSNMQEAMTTLSENNCSEMQDPGYARFYGETTSNRIPDMTTFGYRIIHHCGVHGWAGIGSDGERLPTFITTNVEDDSHEVAGSADAGVVVEVSPEVAPALSPPSPNAQPASRPSSGPSKTMPVRRASCRPSIELQNYCRFFHTEPPAIRQCETRNCGHVQSAWR